MENIIVALILTLVVVATVFYIIRAKKRGQKCIGCPHSKSCGQNCQTNKKM